MNADRSTRAERQQTASAMPREHHLPCGHSRTAVSSHASWGGGLGRVCNGCLRGCLPRRPAADRCPPAADRVRWSRTRMPGRRSTCLICR